MLPKWWRNFSSSSENTTLKSPNSFRSVSSVTSGRKNVLRKLLRISYRRLKAGFFVFWPCSTAFVCRRVSESRWMKCTRCERLLLEKPFYLCVVFVLRHLKITLDSEQPMLKQKRIIPSVWGGIKSFEHFQRREYLSDCAFDLFVSWFRFLSPGWKTRLYSVYLVNTFSRAQIYSLCRTSFILLFSKEPFVRRKTFSEIEGQ